MSNFSNQKHDQDQLSSIKSCPQCPKNGALEKKDGRVKIEFTIAKTGIVKDAVIVESYPLGIFDEAALKAISQWIFKEKIVNGVAVEQRAVQTLIFKMH